MKDKFAYSFDGEYYTGCFGSVEETVKELIRDSSFWYELEDTEQNFAIVHIGLANHYIDKGSDCIYDVIGSFQDRAIDKGGEWSEGYLEDLTKEQEEFLKDGLDKLWKKFKSFAKINSPFFRISTSNQYKVYSDGSYEIMNNKN